MKNAYLLAALASLSLIQSPVEAQSFQARRLSGNFQAAGRQRVEMHFEVTLGARQHIILDGQSGANGVIVREDPNGPESEGTPSLPRAGLPNMGMRMVQVLVPHNAAKSGMRLEILEEQTETIGFFELLPVGVPEVQILEEDGSMTLFRNFPEGVDLDNHGRDTAAYSSQMAIPERSVSLVGSGGLRAYRYARVSFSPFRWNPVTKELTKVKLVKAKLTCLVRGGITNSVLDRELGDPGMKSGLVAGEMIFPDGVFDSYHWPFRDPDCDYLIITTDLIQSTSSQLSPFISMKESQGHDVMVKTVEDIESEYPASGRAESMRKFLRAEYQDLGVEYLLLIGDPDEDDQGDPTDSVGEVPMFATWPGGEFTVDWSDEDSVSDHRCRITPTDMYYTELTLADWDNDGDGFPAEYDDDETRIYYPVGGAIEYGFHVYEYPVDFEEELKGARIPFSNVGDVDDHLQEQIKYQTDDVDFLETLVRRTAILAMAEFSGATAMDTLGRQLESDLSSHVRGPYGSYEIYEFSSYDALMQEDALFDKWSDTWGAGLVVWSGHGSERRTVVNEGSWSSTDYKNFIHASDAPNLTTTFTRSIVISASCLNARSSWSNNLAHELMEHAAVGVFAHTSVMYYNSGRTAAWGDLSLGADYCYLIAENLLDGLPIGDSIQSARSARSPSNQTRTKGLLALTAFGDPSCPYILD
jgi:hypothetical protein